MLSDTLDIHLEFVFKVLCLYYSVFFQDENDLGVLPWGATEGPLKEKIPSQELPWKSSKL